MRWPWKRAGISADEATQSREHLAEARARELTVDHALQRRRATKNRNGFGALIDEGLGGRSR